MFPITTYKDVSIQINISPSNLDGVQFILEQTITSNASTHKVNI